MMDEHEAKEMLKQPISMAPIQFVPTMMDEHEAKEMLKQYSPEQIRYITARLGDMSKQANYTVQAGVKLLTAITVVYLADREESDVQ